MPDAEQYDSSINERLDAQSQEQLAEADEDAAAKKQAGREGAAKAAAAGPTKLRDKPTTIPNPIPQFHQGGVAKKTGPALLQKGETVVPKGRMSDYRKAFIQRGKDGKHKY